MLISTNFLPEKYRACEKNFLLNLFPDHGINILSQKEN